MKTWQMEYYCGFPNIRVRFTVKAKTYEEAITKGQEVIQSLRRTVTYTVGEG